MSLYSTPRSYTGQERERRDSAGLAGITTSKGGESLVEVDLCRTATLYRPRLTAPRAGLIPRDIIGPMAPCACASLFVMMSGSVILPQMRHSHPSYSQAWPPRNAR